VSDTLSSDEKRSSRAEAKWALVMAAVAFIPPWILLFAVPPPPDDSVSQWVEWVVLLVWILAGTFGAACVIAGGRLRRIGAALIVGDVLGVLLFFISLALLASIPTD